jgi:hypothetical protein
MPGKRATLEERFYKFVEKQENGCWLWTGSQTGRGYGQIRRGTREEGNAQAHRVSYEIHVGPIPLDEKGESLFIDHLCYDKDGYSNKLCVNPEHLEPVTDLNNKRRGYVAKKAAGTWVHYKQRKVN